MPNPFSEHILRIYAIAPQSNISEGFFMYYYENNDGNLEKLLKSYEDYLRNANKIDYKIGENKPPFDLDCEDDTRGFDGL